MVAILFLSLSIFLFLSYIVVTQGRFILDTTISDNIHLLYSDTLTSFMKLISTIGAMKESLLLSLFFILWLIFKKRWVYEAKVYSLTLFLSIFSFASIKQLVGRDRPESILVDAYNYSFPSGHSTMAMAIALGVYFVFVDKIRFKKVALSVAISWAILVGFSRIYLNVHWFSDVLAGLSLGVVCAILSKLYVSKRDFDT